MDEVIYPKFRWYVMFTMIIVTATQGIALIGPAPLIPEMLKTMPQYSPGQIVLMTMSSFNLFVALGALFGGILLDKFGVVKVYIGCLVLIGVGAFLMPVIGNNLWGMIFNRMLQGFGAGPIMASSAPLAAAYFPHKERSIVAGFQGFSVAFGIVLGLSIIPGMAVSMGDWAKALMVIGPIAIIVIILPVIVLFGPKPPETATEQTKEEADAGVTHAFKKALTLPVTWAAIAAYFIMSWAFQAFLDVTPGYIGVDTYGGLGLGTVKGGQYLILAQIFFMGGAILGGIITDKVFKGNGRPIMATGFLVGAIFTFFIQVDTVTANSAMLVFCLTGIGLFYSFVNPQVVGYLAKNYPKEITGKLGGLATGLAIFGGWGAATMGGIVIHTSGYPASILINMFTLCIIGFIVSLFLKPMKEVK
ncbi:MFS transporter [Deltaproteobacteria bacterium]|nr:MFS transporter [Deltaproteobacteria bacterium]